MSSQPNVPETFQYLRPAQEAELRGEARSLEESINDRRPGGADKGDMQRRRRQIQRMLDTQSAPDLGPDERDAYAKEARQLESEFTQGMCSAEEMRKNPPGAVDKNMRWQRANRLKVSRWKNLIRALHKGDDSPNIANIERFRPHHTVSDLSMVGAQITGKTFVGTHPSDAYKENHERIFGQPGKKPGKQVAMTCGAMKDPRGRRFHEQHCKACVEILGAQVAAEGSPAAG